MSDSEEGEASESEESDDEVTDFWHYRGGNDALDRILEILQEDDDDEDAEFEGFLPDFERDPPLNFQNFEFDLQPPDFTDISGPRRVLNGSNTAYEYFHIYM